MNDSKIYDFASDEEYLNFFKDTVEKSLFNSDDPNPSRVVFLDATHGWGKTRFLTKILTRRDSKTKVSTKDRVSAIYSTVDEGLSENIVSNYRITSRKIIVSIFSTLIIVYIFLLASVNLISPIFTDGETSLIEHFRISRAHLTNSKVIFPAILVFILLFCTILFGSFPISVPHISDKRTGKDEIRNINTIEKKIKDVLIIEDIDRIEKSENILKTLIFIENFSDFLASSKSKKYIIVTGEYTKLLSKIAGIKFGGKIFKHEVRNLRTNNNDKFRCIKEASMELERYIGVRIPFPSGYRKIGNIEADFSYKNFNNNEIKALLMNDVYKYELDYRFTKKLFSMFWSDNKDNNMRYLNFYLNYNEYLVNYWEDSTLFDNQYIRRDTPLRINYTLLDWEILIANLKFSSPKSIESYVMTLQKKLDNNENNSAVTALFAELIIISQPKKFGKLRINNSERHLGGSTILELLKRTIAVLLIYYSAFNDNNSKLLTSHLKQLERGYNSTFSGFKHTFSNIELYEQINKIVILDNQLFSETRKSITSIIPTNK